MLHLPFAFSTSNPVDLSTIPILANNNINSTDEDKESSVSALYKNMGLKLKGLSEEAFINAMKGFELLISNGTIKNDKLLTIADFTKSSSQKRLYVIDIVAQKVLFHTYVAHGRGSGEEYAKNFSNVPESYQSSLGFYETSGTYNGKNGFSMKLNGLEKGINNLANDRAIVVHGAPYVSEGFVNARGYLGRSHGCPALPEKLNKPIIETIKNGSCLFIYSKNSNYLNKSDILNS
jgi:hypothetical protein